MEYIFNRTFFSRFDRRFLSLILSCLHWRCFMYKSFKINLSLTSFKLVFMFFKLFPLKKKTTFVTEYGVNVSYVANEIKVQTNEEIIILKTETCLEEFDKSKFKIL